MRTLRWFVLFATLCPALALAQEAAPPAGPAEVAAPAPAAPPEAAPAAPAAPPEAFPQQPAAAPQPAPPPGAQYGYGAPGVDANRAKALDELRALDLRIASLREQQRQYSIVAPAAMTAAGFGLGAGFGAVALVEWAIVKDIEDGNCGSSSTRSAYRYSSRCDVNGDGVIDGDDKHAARVLSRTFGLLSAAATGVGIAGTVFLVRRLTKRRAFSPELRELSGRRHQLLQQLRYGGGYTHNGFQLTLSARF